MVPLCSTRRARAFSLIELVLTLSIISAVAAIAVPRYTRAQERYRVERAAHRLVIDLEYAATLARVTSAEVKVHFEKGSEADESFYWFEGVADPDHPDQDYTVLLRDEPYRVVLAEAPGDITYRIDGSPESSRTFIVQAGDAARTVHVNHTSGQVTVN
ncbi:MAG: type II secretion system protein [Phycisphaerales bacterium]|nr:type II secretion system protein [Phycisphaerales bacterium]